jgi:glucose-6-phosphate 1-dehydrogenase
MISNPLRDSRDRRIPRVAGPCVLVMFGVTGDLASKKLLPAVYDLANRGLLPPGFSLVGFARREWRDEDFGNVAYEAVKLHSRTPFRDAVWQQVLEGVRFVPGEFADDAAFDELAKTVADLDAQRGTGGNYAFYLSVPPKAFPLVIQQLKRSGLSDPGQPTRGPAPWRRVVIEKPFGRDLATAQELNDTVDAVFPAQSVFRIDHYLGKETVQNILALRFANGIFEPVWNRRYIDHVQISVAETVGVENRGSYYDKAGALRDMVPNHIMQLISLTAMEPPVSFRADAVRDEQGKILHAIQPLSSEDVLTKTVRGQYGDGSVGGERIPAYRSEPDVPPDSRTETFVAMKLQIDNWRWADVPFYLRTGKCLPAHNTHIVIQFRRAPFVLFRDTPVETLMPNQLVLHIQPEEGISLQFAAKVPGPAMRLGAVDMNFEYSDYFGQQPSTGYERLLHDCMIGDATLFQRADMVEAGWCVVSPVLDVWKALPPRNFPNYAAGTWGPKEADDLMERDGRHWRNFEK